MELEMNKGWEQRVRTLCRPENFHVYVEPDSWALLRDGMTTEELTRNAPKLKLVQDLAKRLAASMTKGTIKYPSDDLSVNTWVEAGLDDAGDGVLYMMLLREALRKEHVI